MDDATRSLNRLLPNPSPGDFDLIEPHLRSLELVRAVAVAMAGN